MYDSTYEALPAIISHEGTTRWMYLDVAGWVTTGKGNKIDDTGSSSDPAAPAVALPWIDKNTGLPATEDVIRSQWATVKARTDLAQQRVGGAEQPWIDLTSIRLSDDAVNQLVQRTARDTAKALEVLHPSVTTAPADAQLAVMRWAWALGPDPRNRQTGSPAYPSMWAAFDSGDYLTAAQQAHWVGEDPHVAVLIAQLFQNAADVSTNGLDPTAVVWPNTVNQAVASNDTFGMDVPSLITKGTSGVTIAAKASSVISKLPALSDSITDNASAISQGSAILDASNDMGSTFGEGCTAGPYGVAAAAAQCIVNELPPGQVTTVLSDAVSVAQAGLEGAAIGSLILPGIGTEVGAVIGAGIDFCSKVLPWIEKDHFDPIEIVGDVVGTIDNALGSISPALSWAIDPIGNLVGEIAGKSIPPQGDYRYLRDKLCFPALSNATDPMGVTPGIAMFNPRANPNLASYQTPVGNNVAWSVKFSFAIGWRSPLKYKDNPKVRKAAWILVQFYDQQFAARRMVNTPKNLVTWAEVESCFPRKRDARTAYNKLCRWYGDPKTFDIKLPYGATEGPPSGYQATQDSLDKKRLIGMVRLGIKEFNAKPLDFAYYPVPVQWDGSAQTHRPTPIDGKGNWASDVMVTADTFKFMLAELAVLHGTNLMAYHLAVQMGHIWHRSTMKDAKIFRDISRENHPNFARVVGLTSSLVIKEHRTGKISQFGAENNTEVQLQSAAASGIIAVGALGVIGILSGLQRNRT